MENSTPESHKPAGAEPAKPTAGAALVDDAGTVGQDAVRIVVAAANLVVETGKAVVEVVVAAGEDLAHAVEPTPSEPPAPQPRVEGPAEAVAPAA
ncbi:MAG: hypothetical protein ACHQ16_07265, partial [Candidatus Lutacidiplasmatales archaeon]